MNGDNSSEYDMLVSYWWTIWLMLIFFSFVGWIGVNSGFAKLCFLAGLSVGFMFFLFYLRGDVI